MLYYYRTARVSRKGRNIEIRNTLQSQEATLVRWLGHTINVQYNILQKNGYE